MSGWADRDHAITPAYFPGRGHLPGLMPGAIFALHLTGFERRLQITIFVSEESDEDDELGWRCH